MAKIIKSALVRYSSQQMFDLVNDIDAYQDFLPWCGGSRVLQRQPASVQAQVEIAHGGLRKAFTTRNHLQPWREIRMELVDGPFRRLEGYWRFDDREGGRCRVSLDLNYEFSNRLIALALGPIFSQIVHSMVDAFSKRAGVVYGER